MVNNLRSNITVAVRFSYTITRNPSNEDDSEDIGTVVLSENTVEITAQDQEIRQGLIEILNETFDLQTTTRFINKTLRATLLTITDGAENHFEEKFEIPEDISSTVHFGAFCKCLICNQF